MCWRRNREQSGVKLREQRAAFTSPRYGAERRHNPDPEVFGWAATQVVTAMNATHKLGGEIARAVGRARRL